MEGIFIGRSMKDNKWVEGYYGIYRNVQNIVYTAITPFDEEFGDAYTDSTVAVCNHSVGEYIGLHDKNGKRIFTGQIVLSSNGTPCVVNFENYEFIMYTKYRELKHRFTLNDDYKFEIIGNIYDNPDLLERK